MWWACDCVRTRPLCVKLIGEGPSCRGFRCRLSHAQPEVISDAPRRTSSNGQLSTTTSARIWVRRLSAAEPCLLANASGRRLWILRNPTRFAADSISAVQPAPNHIQVLAHEVTRSCQRVWWAAGPSQSGGAGCKNWPSGRRCCFALPTALLQQRLWQPGSFAVAAIQYAASILSIVF